MLAITGSIHHFLYKKNPVLSPEYMKATVVYRCSNEYDSCYPFVWCVWAFDFAVWLVFLFRISSELRIFVNLLSYLYKWRFKFFKFLPHTWHWFVILGVVIPLTCWFNNFCHLICLSCDGNLFVGLCVLIDWKGKRVNGLPLSEGLRQCFFFYVKTVTNDSLKIK